MVMAMTMWGRTRGRGTRVNGCTVYPPDSESDYRRFILAMHRTTFARAVPNLFSRMVFDISSKVRGLFLVGTTPQGSPGLIAVVINLLLLSCFLLLSILNLVLPLAHPALKDSAYMSSSSPYSH